MRTLAKTFVALAVCLLATASVMAGGRTGRPVAGRSGGDVRAIRGAKTAEFSPPLPVSGYSSGAQPAAGAKAIDWSEPFVFLTVPRTPLYLGEVCGPNLREVAARFDAHVVANVPYHISASFSGLQHQNRKIAIAPKHMTVQINGRETPVGTGRVPIAMQGPTPPGGVDVPVELQVGVKAKAAYPAGRYKGTLVITITAGF